MKEKFSITNNNNNKTTITAEADAITSFIKGLEDDYEQNKCLSEEVDGNYEINYDDDLDNNHYLPLFMPLNEVERRRALWRF
ncbi:unnamed protein product [Rhizophagus irregularis]|uniref:Uncharacterized protein n=1 Tax=Rhizophagus irregularis TaxID=588596 RepID=A0A915YS74_9GLOM|nr:unnamed protein product [Rhizophagus irregularis]